MAAGIAQAPPVAERYPLAVDLPFRSAEIQAFCGLCKEPAVAECVRCGRPLCPDHEPAADERCPSCEGDYQHRRTPNQLADLGYFILGASLIGAFGFATLFPGGSMAVVGWLAGALGLGASVRGRGAVLPSTSRRRFLRERKTRSLPAPRTHSAPSS